MIQKETIDNRYVILKELGTGGFATVFKAWAEYLERFVALKKIHTNLTQNAKFLDMFRQEAVNMARLDHANVVRAIDYLKTSDNDHYLVMEYVKGRDLRYIMEKCKQQNLALPPDLALHIISEILRALNYAHTVTDEFTGGPLGIVHRDVSPGNIMLFFDGRVKLTDFGIAKTVTQIFEAEKSGWLHGKISYMSPEQAKANAPVDRRSDLFSAGVILYELLTGKPLFRAGDYYSTWQLVLKAKGDMSGLDALKDTCPALPKIKAVLAKALERNAEKRYASAVEMLRDIERCFVQTAYGERRNVLKDFLGRILKAEIQQEGGVLPETLSETSSPAEPASSVEGGKSGPVLDVVKPSPIGEGEKTVFDFVLDTAKRYRRIFLISSLGAFCAFSLFLTFDVMRTWTPLGTRIHDWFWPPALTVDTLPSGAAITVEKDGKSILPENGAVTPCHIDKIAPGNYFVSVTKEGYKKVQRKIFVAGGAQEQNQKISLSGGQVYEGLASDRPAKNVFVIPLEVTLRIQSYPAGAQVWIDGKRLAGKTPLTHDLEVGEHTVKLVLSPFEPLGNDQKEDVYGQCNLNLADVNSVQTGLDRRHWSLQNQADASGAAMELVGTFWRPVSFRSQPLGASVRIDSEPEARGETPITDTKLSVGTHKVLFSKNGFQESEETVSVDANSPTEWSASLKKWIQFQAIDLETGKEAHASVSLNGQVLADKVTPFQLALPMGIYQVRFFTNDNRETTVNADIKDSNSIRGSLRSKDCHLKVLVLNGQTNAPIAEAYVQVNKKFQGYTDENGVWRGKVPSGRADVVVQTKEPYGHQAVQKELPAGQDFTVKVVMGEPVAAAEGCTLTVDLRPHFIGAKIYLNGDLKGTTIRKMKGLEKGVYTVMVQHPDLERTLVQRVEFTSRNQSLSVKLDEDERLVVTEVQEE